MFGKLETGMDAQNVPLYMSRDRHATEEDKDKEIEKNKESKEKSTFRF